jgi:hypothetical protein
VFWKERERNGCDLQLEDLVPGATNGCGQFYFFIAFQRHGIEFNEVFGCG